MADILPTAMWKIYQFLERRIYYDVRISIDCFYDFYTTTNYPNRKFLLSITVLLRKVCMQEKSHKRFKHKKHKWNSLGKPHSKNFSLKSESVKILSVAKTLLLVLKMEQNKIENIYKSSLLNQDTCVQVDKRHSKKR